MYSYTEIVNDVLYTVCFFASFSGHSHPWTPTGPLRFDDIHNGQTYYRAWYSDVKNAPRLDRLQKFYILYDKVNLVESIPKANGNYYYSITKEGDRWEIGEAITPLQALKRTHYVVYVVGKDIEHAEHVFVTIIDDISYKYNSEGVLVDKKIDLGDIPSSIE